MKTVQKEKWYELRTPIIVKSCLVELNSFFANKVELNSCSRIGVSLHLINKIFNGMWLWQECGTIYLFFY